MEQDGFPLAIGIIIAAAVLGAVSESQIADRQFE